MSLIQQPITGGHQAMSIEKARAYLEARGYADRIIETEASSATVELAAQAIGCKPAEIAKTLSFLLKDQPILILAEGDARIDNHKFKMTFHTKAKMIPADQVESLIGHAPGGVCPFGINENVDVYLDESLRKFPYVYPAAGNDHSGVKLTPEELEKLSHAKGWVDVCKEKQNT
jgi:prolyl-tRNA editing enzyme YbaK/EbsC (Cys-tRNA(Pro) deacylase)